MSIFFNELSLQIKVAQKTFQTESDLTNIIKLSLQISSNLMYQASFEQYSEIHSQYISFFAVLKEKLSDFKGKLNYQEIEDAFYFALSYEKIIPRLYISFIIACSFDIPDFLDLIIKILPSVAHPLRGYMLRYTVISFFPLNSEKLYDFAYSNFCEMLILLPQINVIHPSIFDAVLGLISMNISISLSRPNITFQNVIKFLNVTIKSENKVVKMSVIISVIQSISPQLFIENFSYFINLFKKFEVNHETIRTALYICMKTKDPKLSFDFASQTNFSDVCSEKVTKMAIEYKDFDVIKKCLHKWPKNNIYTLLYKELGISSFINNLSDSFHPTSSFTIQLLNDVNSEVPVEIVKKIIGFLDNSHSSEDEEAIIQMLYRNCYGYQDISYLFTPTNENKKSNLFLFKSNQLFQIVMMNLSQSKKNFNLILLYLNQASMANSTIDTKVRFFVICNVWPSDQSDEFLNQLKKFKEISQDDLCLIFSVFKRLDISDSVVDEFLGKCQIKNTLFSMLTYLVSVSKVNLIEKALIKLFEFDGEVLDIVERLKLYFGALNIVSALKTDVPIEKDIFLQVFEIINQSFQFFKKFSMFVLDSNNNIQEKWKSYLVNYSNSKVFSIYHDQIVLIIDLYFQ